MYYLHDHTSVRSKIKNFQAFQIAVVIWQVLTSVSVFGIFYCALCLFLLLI